MRVEFSKPACPVYLNEKTEGALEKIFSNPVFLSASAVRSLWFSFEFFVFKIPDSKS